jgi:hypothetical protein
MIAFWILFILSVLHLALAAPVPVGETPEARSNAVDVFKDRIAALEKRMDIDLGDRWSTNEAYRKDDMPEGNSDPSNAQGDDAPVSPDKDDMLRSESSWDSEQESDARGPDNYYNIPDDASGYLDHDQDGVDDLYYSDWQDEVGAKSSTDGAKSDDHSDDGSGNDDTVQSGQTSAKEGQESEHPVTPEYTTDLEKVLKGSLTLRRRNSGSGAVGTNR